MATMLKLDHITKKFGGLVAVNDLCMEVKEHEIHALIGPNGAGKTTATNMIEGVYPPTSGHIYFMDKEITNMQTYQIARLGIGRTFQNIKVYNTMTALENVMVGGHQLTKLDLFPSILRPFKLRQEEKMLREKAEHMLDYIGLYSIRNELVKNLPYGNRKVLEIGRALMTDPQAHPSGRAGGGPEPLRARRLHPPAAAYHDEGKTLFFIEHNMDVVMNVSQMITVVTSRQDRRGHAQGDPE